MILWKMTFRQIRQRPGRAALTLLSIVIGVAAVVAVTLSTGATQKSYTLLYQTLSGRAALEVTQDDTLEFDERWAGEVEKVPGVQAVVPVVQQPIIAYVNKKRIQLLMLGIDPEKDRAVREYALAAGKFFKNDVESEEILIDAGFARNLGVKVGDRISFMTQRRALKATVVGLLETQGTAAANQGAVLFLPLAVAQDRFVGEGMVDRLQIVIDEAADRDTVQAEIAALLDEGMSVHRPATHNQLADETLLSAALGMDMARAFSVIASVFIVMNTFLMNVSERRRQIAVMRAIGATRGQVIGMLYREATLLGAIGTVLGSIIGVGGAWLLTKAMTNAFQIPMPGLEISPVPFLLAAAFGLVVSGVGAYLPARRAAKVTPLEGMTGVARTDIEALSRRTLVIGLAIVAISGAVFAAAIMGLLPMNASVIGAVCVLIGLVLLLPAGLPRMSEIAGKLLGKVIGVEAKLAQRQLMRNRTRTALTTGVLFVAIATGVGLANSVIDNVQDIKSWYSRAFVGDFFVRAMMPDLRGASAKLPEEVGERLRTMPGITGIDAARFVRTTAAGQSVLVIVRDFPGDEYITFTAPGMTDSEIRARLEQGEVVIGSVLAQRAGLAAGDSIEVKTGKGARKMKVVAVSNDYLFGGLTMYMHSSRAKTMFATSGVDAYIVRADHARLAQVETSLRDLCEKHGVLLQTFTDISTMIDRMVAGIVAGLWVLLVLGFLVASLGVVNTLTMNVLEQTREFGLLRIVAMTRKQLRKAIVAQAVTMGLLALPAGVITGVGLAYLIHLSTLPMTGHPVPFSFHPVLLSAALLCAFAILVLAAWIPAERAARLKLVEALRYQ
jgi:putative ABC transport system permease protein